MAFRVLILLIISCSQSYPATAEQVLDYSSLNAFLYSIRALPIVGLDIGAISSGNSIVQRFWGLTNKAQP